MVDKHILPEKKVFDVDRTCHNLFRQLCTAEALSKITASGPGMEIRLPAVPQMDFTLFRKQPDEYYRQISAPVKPEDV